MKIYIIKPKLSIFSLNFDFLSSEMFSLIKTYWIKELMIEWDFIVNSDTYDCFMIVMTWIDK